MQELNVGTVATKRVFYHITSFTWQQSQNTIVSEMAIYTQFKHKCHILWVSMVSEAFEMERMVSLK